MNARTRGDDRGPRATYVAWGEGVGRSIVQLVRAVADRELGAEANVRAALEAIRAAESGPDALNAFLSLAEERALEEAARIDHALDAGRPAGVLAGVPVAVKDNICTLDLPTTCGSRILEGYVSPYEATVVRRLRAQGAIVVGKTNLDEFAMGSSTENSAFGPTRNPCDPTRVPGGSSGGSAVAVAAGEVCFGLGTDTGGSIRQPAALSGVAGMKPTYGRVSRYGVVAFASSLDQVGPFGRTVRDVALVCQALFGVDPLDATTMPLPAEDLLREVDSGVKGLRLGVPRE
ncbi:MAG: amidase, partial [Longimicrobiales bacterium]